MQNSILILNSRWKNPEMGPSKLKGTTLDPCHAWIVSGQEVHERSMLDQKNSHQEREDVAYGIFDQVKVGRLKLLLKGTKVHTWIMKPTKKQCKWH